MEATKQQRSEHKMAPVNAVLIVLFLGILICASLGMTGCASLTTSKEERLANSCYANGGKPDVMYTETTGRVGCK
jgi:hypothetical protein